MEETIIIRGAREHNLKNIDLDLPRNRLVVVTGLSGSGKSSLAFDTIYAEGQRRYMESLSAYARQFLGMMERPDVDFIDGLSPVIAIDQKTVSRNPRSTVGTVTEIYDFLRLLFARAADAYSYISGRPMRKQSDDEIIDTICSFPEGTRLFILAPVVRSRKGHYRELFEQVSRQGYERVRVDGEFREIEKDMRVDRYKIHDIEVVVDRIVVRSDIRPRVSQSVGKALEMGQDSLIVAIADGEDMVMSRNLTCPEDNLSYDDPSPNLFSFNTPYGACPTCNGLGNKLELEHALMIPDPTKSIEEGGLVPLGKPREMFAFSQLGAVAKAYHFSFQTPIEKLSDEQLRVLMEGAGEEVFDIQYKHKDRMVTYKHRWAGLNQYVWNFYQNTTSNEIRKWAESFLRLRSCPDCKGGRLKPESLSYRVGDFNISDLVRMDLFTLRNTLAGLSFSGNKAAIAQPILKEINDRLDFLLNVGLHYLGLDRAARTLSGGESQRIRLATQIGTQLVGVLYVLDEPSIGLHPRDNVRLIRSLENLRDLGNSVLVVEHDREMIEAADFVVDLGPAAGEHGGEVMAAGSPKAYTEPHSNIQSLTAEYLSDRRFIPIRSTRRAGNGKSVELTGAQGNNLKGDTLQIPLGKFVCVTGVSGSGKSSLINHTLYPILVNHFHHGQRTPLPYGEILGLEHLDKVIDMDQSPIGRTPRSNPATYTGLFTHIRDLFANAPESKIRGYKPGRFSFNVKGGRCETCTGAGIKKLEMNFLPDVYVECETCKGKRYNQETLEVKYKGKTIADVLDMTVEEALDYFEAVPNIRKKVQTLAAVGLGYIRLGQQATTLSGGEAQRIKLATELSRPATGKTLYILDEPTTGLHFEDIRHLLQVLHALVEKGNSVLVIEHNMEVVKTADWVIDLGPDGGAGGGQIVCTGTPEEVAQNAASVTGSFLKVELERAHYEDEAFVLNLEELRSEGSEEGGTDETEPDETSLNED